LILGFLAVHISQFIEKSMFGDSGYLALTLPITRGRLLISKFLTAWVWFNFTLAAMFFALTILEETQATVDASALVVLPSVSVSLIAYYLNLSFVFFFATNVMLFGLTLHNSVFGRWKVPGFITAFLSLGIVIGYSIAAIRLLSRSRVLGEVEVATIVNGFEATVTREELQNIMGLDVGRIPMLGSYLDLYVAVMGLVLGLLAFFATWYLLKKRVSLQ